MDDNQDAQPEIPLHVEYEETRPRSADIGLPAEEISSKDSAARNGKFPIR